MTDVEPGHAPADSTHLLKAVVLVVVVVVIAILVLREQRPSSGSAAGVGTTTTSTLRSAASTTTTSTVALLAPAQVKLQVLNGLRTGNLAGKETTKLATSPGYATLPPNDTTVRTTASVIYCASGYYAEGLQLSTTVGLAKSAVRHRIPTSAPLPSGVKGNADLILVIGTSLASKV